MSKTIDLLNHVRQLRDIRGSIFLDGGDITLYEPLTKEADIKKHLDEIRPSQVGGGPSNDFFKILVVVTFILAFGVIVYLYSMSLNIRRDMVAINQAVTNLSQQQLSVNQTITNLNQQQASLQTKMDRFQEDLKNLSTSTVSQVNSLDNNINQVKSEVENSLTQRQKAIDSNFESITTQLHELKSLIQSTPQNTTVGREEPHG